MASWFLQVMTLLVLTVHSVSVRAESTVPPAAGRSLDGAMDGSVQEELSRSVADKVRGSLAEYFVHAGLAAPQIESTTVAAKPDASDPAAATILRVKVRLVTDLPPSVIREARMHVLRDFEASGQPLELMLAADVGASPRKSLAQNGRAVLTLTALVLLALSLMALSGAMLARGWRRTTESNNDFSTRTRRAGPQDSFLAEPPVGLHDSPVLASKAFRATAVINLPPFPPAGERREPPPPPMPPPDGKPSILRS